jgi:hypothetical protein
MAEFIELLNISSSVSLNLRGVRFTTGVEFDFTGSPVALLPGGRALVVRDLAAFSAIWQQPSRRGRFHQWHRTPATAANS